jgi:hypothetical protein
MNRFEGAIPLSSTIQKKAEGTRLKARGRRNKRRREWNTGIMEGCKINEIASHTSDFEG